MYSSPLELVVPLTTSMPSENAFAPAQGSLLGAFRELYRFRVLVLTLVSRQLKARYRGSLMGFLWTILNPLLFMAVYAMVFRYFMRIEVENYAVFLFSGIIAWTYFSQALGEGTNSILSGGTLITKSLFPPHVLPTVTVLSQLVNYLFSLPVLFAFMIAYGIPLQATVFWLPVILLIQTAFTWGFVLGLAALNVHFRDTQHVLGNILTLWFFLCPVIYPAKQIPEWLQIARYVNPIGLAIDTYHQILLYGTSPSATALAVMVGFAILSIIVGNRVLDHYRETFPELV